LQTQLQQAQVDGKAAVADAHRQHRSELVPVRQSMTVYRRRRPRSD
jgi:hypothetical protein